MFKSRVNTIIFIAFILCTFFISFFFLIYIINFIFLVDCRFENVCLTFILIIVCAINNELCIIFAYILVSCMFFSILFTFFS